MPREDLTPAASEDLKEIWNHISQDSVFQADRLLGRFSLKFDYLAIHSGMGRPRPELAADNGILVLRVRHSARDIRQISFPP